MSSAQTRVCACERILAGFIIAFTYGWSMTLVMLGVLPFLALAGGVIGECVRGRGRATQPHYRAVNRGVCMCVWVAWVARVKHAVNSAARVCAYVSVCVCLCVLQVGRPVSRPGWTLKHTERCARVSCRRPSDDDNTHPPHTRVHMIQVALLAWPYPASV